MQRTSEVLFDGRKRFENGDVLVQRELLQSLGSNITILDVKLNITTYKWLIPIQENYKTLEKQFDEVRTSSEQKKIAKFRLFVRIGGSERIRLEL